MVLVMSERDVVIWDGTLKVAECVLQALAFQEFECAMLFVPLPDVGRNPVRIAVRAKLDAGDVDGCRATGPARTRLDVQIGALGRPKVVAAFVICIVHDDRVALLTHFISPIQPQ